MSSHIKNVIVKRKFRPLLNFSWLINNNFLLWILFPDNKDFNDFKVYMKRFNILVLSKYVSNIKKTKNKFETLNGSALFVISFKNEGDLNKALLFFMKDKYFEFKNSQKIKNIVDWSDCFYSKNSFIIAIKLYKYIFSFDLFFFKLYNEIKYYLSINNHFYYLSFVKIVYKTLIAVMVVFMYFVRILLGVFFKIINQFLGILIYANQKSTGS